MNRCCGLGFVRGFGFLMGWQHMAFLVDGLGFHLLVLPAPEEPPVILRVDRMMHERCAAVRASLDCRPDDRDTLLEQEELAPATFTRLIKHWQLSVRDANQRGDYSLMKRQDQAYLERVEQERGELTAGDYAQLKVALERGNQPETAATLKIPLAALMPLERQWLARSLSDPTLAAATRKAVARARAPIPQPTELST